MASCKDWILAYAGKTIYVIHGKWWVLMRVTFAARVFALYPIPLLTSPLKGEELSKIPFPSGEGQGGDGSYY
jgi:hypothetical protein